MFLESTSENLGGAGRDFIHQNCDRPSEGFDTFTREIRIPGKGRQLQSIVASDQRSKRDGLLHEMSGNADDHSDHSANVPAKVDDDSVALAMLVDGSMKSQSRGEHPNVKTNEANGDLFVRERRGSQVREKHRQGAELNRLALRRSTFDRPFYPFASSVQELQFYFRAREAGE